MFNIRVYGILINSQDQVLVSDEFIRGAYITKFCGGGLEFGEGLIDCVKREFMEEMNLPIRILEHFYTTDFFQPSAFDKNAQVISIYYRVEALEDIKVPLRNKPFDFDEVQLENYRNLGETETFRWVNADLFSPDIFQLPIDKRVAEMIAKQLLKK